ncbi:MAG: DinB family protein [Ktedonobacterales bacterium]
MPELTMQALEDISGRLRQRELTVEGAASDYSLAELCAALTPSRARAQAVAEGWTQAQLWFQPPGAATADSSEDRWSATEALTHLIATQNWYLLHMGRLLGRREHFDLMVRGLGDQAHADVPKADLARDLRAATTRMLNFCDSIPADADLTARRDSTFFGDLSLRGWVLLALQHDTEHLAQIERLTRLPGFPAA